MGDRRKRVKERRGWIDGEKEKKGHKRRDGEERE